MKFKTLAYGVMAYLCLAFHVAPAPVFQPGQLSIGVSSIERVENWSNLCPHEAGDEWFNPFGDRVELKNLVDEVYFSPDHNWWMEAFVFEEYNCVDNDTYGDFDNSNFNQFCVTFDTENQGAMATSVTFQVVSECSPFCNGINASGTWYKDQMTVDPVNFGDACASGNNQMALVLQPRVQCDNTEKRWGCGPDESQD